MTKKSATLDKPQELQLPCTIATNKKPLMCLLNTDEILKAGHDLANVSQDIANEEARAKEVKAELNARMAELETRWKKLTTTVVNGKELRDVDVEVIIFRPDEGPEEIMAKEVRKDTGEVINLRALYEDERQATLPISNDADKVAAEFNRTHPNATMTPFKGS